MPTEKTTSKKKAKPATPTEPQPEIKKLYTVTKGPIKVRSMLLAKGHKDLALTDAEAQVLADNVTAQIPTI
jgi:hypothetical protein